MAFFNGSSALRLTKWIIALLSLLLIALAIWFLGPFLGFGETRPLATTEPRVIFIILAVLCFIGLLYSVPLILLFLVTSAVMVWVFGPWLLVGESYPLAEVVPRATLIIALLFIALLYGAWRLLMAVRLDPALLDKFFKDKALQPEEQYAREVTRIIRHAANYIKGTQKKLAKWRFSRSAHYYLDKLPWYMTLGPEGAGKTSTVLASGLSFPVPEQLTRIGKESQPTLNCECWFANEAIFIDTAGKYINEDKSADFEWTSILKALKKYRPLKSINGVIVTLPAEAIMGQDKKEIFTLASRIRARLDEMKNSLGVCFPVYVLITRLDELAGFAEYFRTLTPEEREQIWGFTLPYNQHKKMLMPDLKATLNTELALLEERIEGGLTVRMQDEYDATDRKRIYAFPQDFRELAAGVSEVVHHIFFSSKYDDVQNQAQLRGVYFLSAMQQGNTFLVNKKTLIQKWKTFITGNSAAPEKEESDGKSRDLLVNDAIYGRQYFLKRLFSDVIVPDAHLARFNSASTSRYRFRNIVGHTLCIGIVVWLLNSFYHSYRNNTSYLDEIVSRVTALENETKRFSKSTQEAMLPVLLRLSQELPYSEQFDVASPPLNYRYGLYVGYKMLSASESLYVWFLKRLLLPAIEDQATYALEKAIQSGELDTIYRQLKTYLLVYGQGKMDEVWLTNSLFNQWQAASKTDMWGDRETLEMHFQTLLAHSDWRKYGREPDNELISQARTPLQNNSSAARLYERLKEKIAQDEVPDNLTLSKLMEEQDTSVLTLTDTDLALRGVPGLFTWDGYHHFFKGRLNEFIKQLQSEDSWIIGTKEKLSMLNTQMPVDMLKGGMREGKSLQEAVLKLYLKEYARTWNRFISSIALKTDTLDVAKNNNLTFDIYALRIITATDSPLKNLLVNIVREITLVDPSVNIAGSVSFRGSNLLGNAMKMKDVVEFREKKLLRENVDNHFNPLRQLVGYQPPVLPGNEKSSRKGGEGLDAVLSMLREHYMILVVTKEAIKNGDTPPEGDKAQQLRAAALTWPEPLGNIILPLLNKTTTKVNNQIVLKMNSHAQQGIGEICRSVIAGKYPFTSNGQEIGLHEFESFFGKGGTMDQYFADNLADQVDTSIKPWRYKQEAQGAVSGRAVLSSFELAADIQRHFFQSDDGKKFNVNFAISVAFMDPSITAAKIKFDDQQFHYKHGPVMPENFNWPGALSGTLIDLSLQPAGSTTKFIGPWALLRWLDSAESATQAANGHMLLTYSLNKKNNASSHSTRLFSSPFFSSAEQEKVQFEVAGLSSKGVLLNRLIKSFRCPSDRKISTGLPNSNIL